MRLLVTGGAGFIGSNFINHILNEYPEYQIINLDKLTYAGSLENLREVEHKPNYKFVKGDICNAEDVGKALAVPAACLPVGMGRQVAFRDIDVILNFAAETHVDRSIVSAGDFVHTNVYGTYVLLEAVRKHKVSRYIQISTDEVYGSIEEGSFTEESPLRPNSPYAASKAAADLLVRSYYMTYGLPVVITRSSNNFGPHQYPEKLIPLFITNALKGSKLPLYGDGQNVRDWIYVEDNCRAIDLVLRKGIAGEIYNIAGETEKKNVEIAEMILKILGKGKELLEYVADRPGHDRRYAIDSSKIRKLGFAPGFDFSEALERTVRWYRENV